MHSLSDTLCEPDKAECYFQPKIVGDGVTGRASLSQIRTAASALFLKCASNDPSRGGIVRNIGKSQSMQLLSGQKSGMVVSRCI